MINWGKKKSKDLAKLRNTWTFEFRKSFVGGKGEERDTEKNFLTIIIALNEREMARNERIIYALFFLFFLSQLN